MLYKSYNLGGGVNLSKFVWLIRSINKIRSALKMFLFLLHFGNSSRSPNNIICFTVVIQYQYCQIKIYLQFNISMFKQPICVSCLLQLSLSVLVAVTLAQGGSFNDPNYMGPPAGAAMPRESQLFIDLS